MLPDITPKMRKARRDESRAHPRTRRLDCKSCGKPMTHHAGRRPSYCSARCRMREFGKGRWRYQSANETPKNRQQ
jgi:endogenous inhibitor of DNA gyrase (YacG/DUF329 family)